MEPTKKLNDLTTNNTYIVQGYSTSVNSKFGNNYILLLCEKDSSNTFEMWSTNSLAEYINNVKPKGKFTFVVNERNNVKYPVIENHKKERNFNMLN